MTPAPRPAGGPPDAGGGGGEEPAGGALGSASVLSPAGLRYTRRVPLPPTPRPPWLNRAGVIVALYLGLAAAALVVGAWCGQANVLLLPGRPWPRSPLGLLGDLGIGTAFALVTVFLWRWAVHRLEWARRLRREFREVLGPLSAGEILVLAAGSSIGEEMFFRGALLPALPAGLWLSSLLFALPHVGPGARFLPWTASSLVAGLAFGAMFVLTGNLLAPVAAHFLINLINLRHITERAR